GLEPRHRFGGDLAGVERGIERRITREQLVGERAEAVDVVGRPRRFTRELLRARRERRSGRTARGIPLRRAGAEIGEQRTPRGIEQDVGWLEVAMDDAPR